MSKKEKDIAFFVAFCYRRIQSHQGVDWRRSDGVVRQVWRDRLSKQML